MGAFVLAQLTVLGVQDPVAILVSAIPLNFYALLSLALLFVLLASGKDFGPMKRAQRRAREEGKLHRDGAQPLIGDDVIAITELTSLPYVTLADLIKYGLASSLDFDLSSATVQENDLLAWGLVTPNKLDNNNLVQDTNPDTVNVGDLVSLGLVTLEDLAEQMTPAELQLAVTDVDQTSVFSSNVLGVKYLENEGFSTSGPIDVEQLIAAGPVTQDEITQAGLIRESDFSLFQTH